MSDQPQLWTWTRDPHPGTWDMWVLQDNDKNHVAYIRRGEFPTPERIAPIEGALYLHDFDATFQGDEAEDGVEKMKALIVSVAEMVRVAPPQFYCNAFTNQNKGKKHLGERTP